MRIIAWLKVLVVSLLMLSVTCYAIYGSDWFQKSYLYPFPHQALVFQYAFKNELDPWLVAGVIRTESKFVLQARSPKGALGLMQLMPETATWIAEQLEYRNFQLKDLENPEVNIRFGTWYLASLKHEFEGNEVLMLAAYNGGRGNVKHWMQEYGWTMTFGDIRQIPFPETKEYVSKVICSKKRYQELYIPDGQPKALID